jgi:hypothetical protein
MPLIRELLVRTIHDIVSSFTPRGEGDTPESADTIYRIAEHQRHYIWSIPLQQTLIDSVMKGYPIPSIQLIRCIKGEMFYNIEDGQQRITTLYRFMNDMFEADVNGLKKYSQLTEKERMHFMTYPIQCDIYNEKDITIDDRIKIFQRINSCKPLTDNQKFYSCIHSVQGRTLKWFIEKYSKQIKKYIGPIGKGKPRSKLSHIIGALIALQKNDRSHITTSYLINSEFMNTERDETSITSFFDTYFQMLDILEENSPKCYGTLSGPLGLALCSWIKYNKIHDSISWYILKRVENENYVPSSIRDLPIGHQRNCQGNSIKERLKAIIKQYNKDKDDEGYNESDDESE